MSGLVASDSFWLSPCMDLVALQAYLSSDGSREGNQHQNMNSTRTKSGTRGLSGAASSQETSRKNTSICAIQTHLSSADTPSISDRTTSRSLTRTQKVKRQQERYPTHITDEDAKHAQNYSGGRFCEVLSVSPERHFPCDGLCQERIKKGELSFYDPNKSDKAHVVSGRFTLPFEVPDIYTGGNCDTNRSAFLLVMMMSLPGQIGRVIL